MYFLEGLKLFYLPFSSILFFTLCGDTVVLACSLEHKILWLKTAGPRYSTWCLTASHTVCQPQVFWLFHHAYRLRLCASQQLSNVKFHKVGLANCRQHRGCVYMLAVALYMFGGGGFLCSFSPTATETLAFKLWGRRLPRARAAVPLTSKKKSPASESAGQGDSLNSLSCRSSQLLAFHLPNLPLHEALFYQHHSLKRISATPNLSVEGLLVAHFALPLPLFVLFFLFFSLPPPLPHSQNPPVFLHCVSSFCSNERQGSARQTPGV